MKSTDIKPSTYIDSNKESNNKDPKFKIGGIVRISKYKNIFAQGYVPSWLKKFLIKKVKNTAPWTYVISDLNGQKIFEIFYENELQKNKSKRV